MGNKTGLQKINKLSPLHVGSQPIRVLKFNIAHAFANTNADFLNLTLKIMQDNGLQAGIEYRIEKLPVKIPSVSPAKKISIQETFLSYVWCVSYALTVLYDEALSKMSRNRVAAEPKEEINQELLKKAEAIWNYGRSLIAVYSEWDTELPNPECYAPEDQWWIERINGVYVKAVNFLFCHEFAHVEKQHFEKRAAGENTDAHRKAFEKEADERAIELVLMGSTAENATTVRFGILIGLCSLLFFNSSTSSQRYPSMDDRIHAILEKVNPEPEDGMWGVATLAFKLWDGQFAKMYTWNNDLKSYKELYYFIKAQIEKENNI